MLFGLHSSLNMIGFFILCKISALHDAVMTSKRKISNFDEEEDFIFFIVFFIKLMAKVIYLNKKEAIYSNLLEYQFFSIISLQIRPNIQV